MASQFDDAVERVNLGKVEGVHIFLERQGAWSIPYDYLRKEVRFWYCRGGGSFPQYQKVKW